MNKDKALILVDDDAANLGATARYLEERGGFIVESFGTAKEALERLERNDVLLVITGWSMPEVDGYAFARTIRRTRRLPIVVWTGKADEPRLLALQSHQPNIRAVQKPDFDKLLEVVRYQSDKCWMLSTVEGMDKKLDKLNGLVERIATEKVTHEMLEGALQDCRAEVCNFVTSRPIRWPDWLGRILAYLMPWKTQIPKQIEGGK